MPPVFSHALSGPARCCRRRLRVAPPVHAMMLPPFVARPFVSKPHLDAQSAATSSSDLAVGELKGNAIRIDPLRRVGEDDRTMRARLLYQSRKRGILECELLLANFANENLPNMTKAQMQQYDLFLDENDWDIYYWASQEGEGEGEAPRSHYSSSSSAAAASADGPANDVPTPPQRAGEWPNTVGTVKAQYRPVPARWKDSEILRKLRAFVCQSRADSTVDGVERDRHRKQGGLGFAPPLFDVNNTGTKN